MSAIKGGSNTNITNAQALLDYCTTQLQDHKTIIIKVTNLADSHHANNLNDSISSFAESSRLASANNSMTNSHGRKQGQTEIIMEL